MGFKSNQEFTKYRYIQLRWRYGVSRYRGGLIDLMEVELHVMGRDFKEGYNRLP